jgi:hypothetical protein
MVSNNVPLSDLMSINPKFLRSVHIERDFFLQDDYNSFLITRGGLFTFSQLARGVQDPAYRAQSISGPYGTGKSAMAMHFARLLAKDGSKGNSLREQARTYLDSNGSQLLLPPDKGYIPILVTGSREKLAKCLIDGLKNSLKRFGADKLLNKVVKGKTDDFDTKDIVQVFEELARLAVTEGASGIIIIVDELGKLLEYAALHPDESDIHLLQEMAEAASRSKINPLWFVAILHQEFSHYAFRLGRKYQQEWAKVQQRFFDIPIVLDDVDSLFLIARAINSDQKVFKGNKNIQSQLEFCTKLAPKSIETNFEELALSSYPLHPTTLLLLPALFRKFGQGERSLFSFISANEPYSLRDWVNGKSFQEENPPLMRLSDLYDYTYHTLIAGKPNQYSAKAWTEVEDAIIRLGNASALEVEVLKTIGLLGLIGDSSHTAASREYLYLALESSVKTRLEIDKAIKNLEDKKLIIFRRFRKAYRLWEGSDININERLAEAYQSLPLQSISLSVSVARDLCPEPPLVAREHSFRTGMLRYFSLTPCLKDNILAQHDKSDKYDGYIFQCLVESDEEKDLVKSIAQKIEDPSIIIIIGKETDELADAARDMAALNEVKKNTPALAADRVARQELSERRLEAEIAFKAEWSRIFSPGQSNFICYWKGTEKTHLTKRAFIEILSQACDHIYPHAPIVKNELINQRTLSSSAAAARRSLIEAMMAQSELPGLGITGYPPQRSIYESLLLQSGIHQEENPGGKWQFGRPGDADSGLQKAWDHIVELVNTEDLKPKPIDEIFNKLIAPPYGIADGFAPILLYACLLSHSATMAVYEDDVFVPDVNLAVMERLMKRPEHFSVVAYSIDGERSAVVERFSKGFQVEKGVLPVVRSLYSRMGTLPPYTLSTRDISSDAIAVREAILKAKSPERLLFSDLPSALGYHPFDSSPNNKLGQDKVSDFFTSLNTVLQEYISCYPELIKRIKIGILKIFNLPDSTTWRLSISQHASKLSDIVLDSKLRVLMVRAQDDKSDEKSYLESIAGCIIGQHPNRWSKSDEDNFWRLVPEITSQVLVGESSLQLKMY